MTTTRFAVLCLLLCLSSCSKHPNSIVAPIPERSAQSLRQSPDPRYDPAGLIRYVDVDLKGSELRIVLWSTLSMDTLGTGFDVQATFDTDQNPDTYPYGQYVARVLERVGDTFPVRIGAVDEHDPGSPDPTSGGWGEISGYGEMDSSKHKLTLHIPLSSLGNDDGVMDWEVDIYRDPNSSSVRGSTR